MEDGFGEGQGASSEHSELKLTVRKVLASSLVIGYVGAGLIVRQASHILGFTADRKGLLKLNGAREN
jgi:hypothetical protein